MLFGPPYQFRTKNDARTDHKAEAGPDDDAEGYQTLVGGIDPGVGRVLSRHGDTILLKRRINETQSVVGGSKLGGGFGTKNKVGWVFSALTSQGTTPI